MDYTEFVDITNQVKEKNEIIFGINSCEKVDDETINCFKSTYGVELPQDYIDFLKEYGTGYFVFTTVYSINQNSEWSLSDTIYRNYLSKNFFPFSDNGCGDYYGFSVNNGVCEDIVYFYDHETNCVEETKYKNIFEYLIEVGLKVNLGDIEL